MVNLWPGVSPKCLCDKHLNAVLAEFNNKFLPSMRKGHAIDGYLNHGCIDLPHADWRINECLEEAQARGHEWRYREPSEEDCYLLSKYFNDYETGVRGKITDPAYFFGNTRREEMFSMNRQVLSFRCPECRARMEKYYGKHER